MRPERSRRRLARARLVALALVGVGAGAGWGCSTLSYPEAAPDGGLADAAQTHVALPHDPGAWVALSRDGRDAMRVRDYAAAEESYVAALAETASFPIHDTRVRTALGNVLRVAQALQARGDHPGAGRLIGHVVRSADGGRLADFAVAAPIFVEQAGFLTRTGEPEAAVALYETGLTLYGANDPAQTLKRLQMQQLLGNAWVALGRPDDAAPLLLAALQGVQSRFGPESLQASRVLVDVAALRGARGDFAGAERDLLAALAIQEREIGGSLEHAVNENRIAWLYLEHDRSAEALRHARASVALLDALGVDGPPAIASLDTLASAEANEGRVADAAAHFARALALYDALDPGARVEVVALLDHYADFARSTGDRSRADTLAARAVRERAGSEGSSD